MMQSILKARMKALDDLDDMLDTRDAEAGRKIKKEHGIVDNKGSETDLDGDGLGKKQPARDESTPHDGDWDVAGRTSSQDADDEDNATDGGEGESGSKKTDQMHAEEMDSEDEDDLMSQLKDMHSKGDANAGRAMATLEDDEDEEPQMSDKASKKKHKGMHFSG